MGTTAVIAKLKEEKGIEWEDQPDNFKYGTYVKKELSEKEGENPLTNEKVTVMRGSIVSKSFNLKSFSPENLDLVFRKYW